VYLPILNSNPFRRPERAAGFYNAITQHEEEQVLPDATSSAGGVELGYGRRVFGHLPNAAKALSWRRIGLRGQDLFKDVRWN
jgi:hypothetical protein